MVTTTLSLFHDSHETIISLVQPKKAQGRDQQGHLVTVWQGWDFGMKDRKRLLSSWKGKPSNRVFQEGIKYRGKKERRVVRQRKNQSSSFKMRRKRSEGSDGKKLKVDVNGPFPQTWKLQGCVFTVTSLPGDKMEVNTYHRVRDTYDCNVFNTVCLAVLLSWLSLTGVLTFCRPAHIKKMI